MATDQELTTMAFTAAQEAISDLADDVVGLSERLADADLLDDLDGAEAEALIERFAALLRQMKPMKIEKYEPAT